MSDPAGTPAGDRVLVLAPTGKDADRSRSILAGAGVAAVPCPDVAGLCRELAAGAGAAVLTEEAVTGDRDGCLAAAVRDQPPWSDLPLIVLTGGGADSPAAARAFETLGNVTLLDRPVRVATLVSAVRAALRSRRKQYEVRDHLAERARAEAALREADRRKDEFLATLAHELRNPLAPVRTALEILRRRAGGDPEAGRLVGMMERQVSHLVRLVDDLLDVSRITRGRAELRRQPVGLAGVIARAVEAARPDLDARRHRLEVDLPARDVVLDADPDRLEQVVTNLLTNAAKYTPHGGRVRVADDGIGIRPEMLPRLFDLFQQADRVPGRMSEGLGIGLSLVRGLVELHGGTVSAASPGPGLGSEFVVRLSAAPTADPPPGPAGPAAGPALAPARRLRIVVVDDNADGAESLATLLGFAGHDVRVCHDGPAALAVVPAFRPDVVLCDIGLPGLDGYEVARRLRGLGLGPAALVALTGYGQEEDRRRSREAGFQAHLVKPVDPQALAGLLAEIPGR